MTTIRPRAPGLSRRTFVRCRTRKFLVVCFLVRAPNSCGCRRYRFLGGSRPANGQLLLVPTQKDAHAGISFSFRCSKNVVRRRRSRFGSGWCGPARPRPRRLRNRSPRPSPGRPTEAVNGVVAAAVDAQHLREGCIAHLTFEAREDQLVRLRREDLPKHSEDRGGRRPSGTMCSRAVLAFSGGTRHSPSSRSMSRHRAFRTSPELAAVKIKNWRASRPTEKLPSASLPMKAGTSLYGIAAKLPPLAA